MMASRKKAGGLQSMRGTMLIFLGLLGLILAAASIVADELLSRPSVIAVRIVGLLMFVGPLAYA